MPALRTDLLDGRRVVVSGDLHPEVRRALSELGAGLELLRVEELSAEEERVGEWARGRAPLDALVHSAESGFGSGGQAGLLAALDEAWTAVREVAVGALIGSEAPGKIVLLAPRPEAGPLAEAARAGLENLIRTVSVEWARYGVTAVMLAPGQDTLEADIGAVAAFLVSEAGGYFSGCRLTLGAVG